MQRRSRGRPLQPAEIAEAVVLADLSLALTIVGQVMPFGSALLVAAVVPLAVVGARHRLRAVVAGAIAAAAVGFLVIGLPALTTMAGCAAFGALIGAADRRGWSRRKTMVLGTLILWPPIAAIVDLMLWVFSDLRKLTLEQIQNSWRGLFHFLQNLGLDGIANTCDRVVAWIVRDWWASFPIIVLFGVVFGVWVSYGLSRVALTRVRVAFGRATAEAALPTEEAAPDPLPVTLNQIGFRYPNADTDALADVSLTLSSGELVAVVGPNGSGKSTLARIIAGRRAPTTGNITRAGAVGLGRFGGTAIVFQRPEAQVLGVRVADDVVWGLPDATSVDIPAVLTRVGLADFADRETSTLSGGELQRLAIAAALARQPQLLVSDESTAMVDHDGRGRVVALLEELARGGTGVVHVTHYPSEAMRADRVITLDRGRVVTAPPARSDTLDTVARVPGSRGGPIIELVGVGHVYSRRTPWAHRALEGVDLAIHERESILVVGHNGSGKSTLAWILAGLIVPSEGRASLVEPGDAARPLAASIGRIGLAFQHARLQLLRPTVGNEVRVGAGVDESGALAALRSVGLEANIAGRRVDELSGGQLRRVVLAEVLATRPRAIVLDEPFAGLDLDARSDLEALLTRVRDEHGIALVIVSHDHDLPPALVERVVELEAGRVVRDERVGDVVGEATS